VVRGAVPDDERLAALAACDVLLLPLTGEAFGIVYLEAWAYRKPVIGARIASVASIVEDGKDGFLVPPGQPELLAERLSQMADHVHLAQQMWEQGYLKLKQRYTVERIADIVEGTCARVLRRRRTLHGASVCVSA
jgi:glycosyltransferase involved in cell wall biosynthesis